MAWLAVTRRDHHSPDDPKTTQDRVLGVRAQTTVSRRQQFEEITESGGLPAKHRPNHRQAVELRTVNIRLPRWPRRNVGPVLLARLCCVDGAPVSVRVVSR